jgi:carbonic anhydrase
MGLASALASTGGGVAIASGVGPPMAAHSASEALELLEEGNERFVEGHPKCGPRTARIGELQNGQSPFAIVLGCSDSRVPIETIFDQVPGNLFVVRVAGNFVNDDGLGSIEYSVANLKSKLILVLGHQSCGAVQAAVGYVKDGASQPGHIQNLVTAIEPAAKATKGLPGDWVANAVAENVKMNVAAMTARSTIVADAVKAGTLKVSGAVYSLHDGKVTFLK